MPRIFWRFEKNDPLHSFGSFWSDSPILSSHKKLSALSEQNKKTKNQNITSKSNDTEKREKNNWA